MTIRLILFYFDIKSAGQNVWTGNADTAGQATGNGHRHNKNGMPQWHAVTLLLIYRCIQK